MRKLNKKNETISLRINSDDFLEIKKIAHRLSLKNNQDIKWSDLIRKAIDEILKDSDEK